MEENAYLVLGCYGRIDDGLVLCSSTENRILKLDDTLDQFDQIVEYFENLRLFDRPIMDQNALRHLIHNLQKKYFQNIKPIWSQSKFTSMEKYLHMHGQCGVYARLIVVQEEKSKPKPKPKVEEPSYPVKAVSHLKLVAK